MISPKCWQQWLNWFFQEERAGFEQSPITLGIPLVPERENLFCGVDRGTHILTPPVGADRPSFVQEIHISSRLDFPHKTNVSGRNW